MAEHSKLLSPSASGIWTKCTAQPLAVANANFPYETNDAAELGTWKHDLSEEMFIGIIDEADKPDDMDVYDWNEVLLAVSEAQKFLPEESDTVLVKTEMKVGFSGWRGDCFGTADLVAYDIENKHLYVGDYKFGRVAVGVEGNTQLMIYGLATIETLEREGLLEGVESVSLAIIQPKVQHDAFTIEMTMNELGQWERDVLIPAQKAILDNKGTNFLAGPWCSEKYCDLHKAGVCPTAVEKVEELFQDMVEAGIPTADNLPKFLELMKNKKLIESTIATAFAIATDRAKMGEEIEGFKLVKGKGKRAWADETKVAGYLKNKLKRADIYTEKLITGPQAEVKLKQAGKLEHGKSLKAFENQITYNEGALTLVPDSNPKPAIVPKQADELEEHYANEVSVDSEDDELFNDLF